MRVKLILFICFFSSQLNAQSYSAYVNARQEFYVFDDGAINKVDYLRPISYGIGKNAVAYVDNQRNFKVYKDGIPTTISDLFTIQFRMTDNFIAYRSAQLLSVIDGHDVKLLSKLCSAYDLGDSIVVYYDDNKQTLNAYYGEQNTVLESFLLLQDGDFAFGKSLKVGDNICAYVNYNDAFKCFYQNENYTLENQAVTNFDLGRNTLAYVDINNQFKIFHKGQSFTVSSFAPKSFQVGDDLVAFVSFDGYFKIFYDGKLFNIGYYDAQYAVKDFMVAYQDINGYFKVFYNGENEVLENYYPENLTMHYRSLVYVNRANTLRMFSKGKVYDVTNMAVDEVRLDYDVLQFKNGFNSFKIFSNGEMY